MEEVAEAEVEERTLNKGSNVLSPGDQGLASPSNPSPPGTHPLDLCLHLHLLLLAATGLMTNTAKKQRQNMNFHVSVLLLACLFIMCKYDKKLVSA
jgi:hypothetical protein